MPNASAAGTTGRKSAGTPSTRACAGAVSRISSARASRAIMLKWLALAALIVVADQATKYAAVKYLAASSIEVTSFFNLVLAYNSGAAFSFLADAAGWQRGLFIGIALVAVAWIVYLLR